MFQWTIEGVVNVSRRKPKPWDDRAKGPGLRHDVQELYLQKVSGLGSLHQYRTSERMNRPRLHESKVGFGGVRVELAIDGVPGLKYYFLAFLHFDYRRNVGMPPVMPRVGLIF